MAAGEAVGAIAMTEPGAGSDLKGVRTRAELRGDKYILNGSKTYISNALNMGLLIVVAKTDPQAGSKGMSLILMEPHGTPGFTVGRVLDKIGMQSQDTCELFFQDCEVPAENVLGGTDGRGMYQLMDAVALRARLHRRAGRRLHRARRGTDAGLHPRAQGLRTVHLRFPEQPVHPGRSGHHGDNGACVQ